MKKTYSTKKALLASALSLFLCVAMLAGSTFAWFTDSVTSDNNIIQTGNLDVEMFWAEGGEAVPAAGDAAWTDASTGAMFKHGNWEPGYAQARHILIANEGSLALNYSLRIVANGVVSKLADVIDVYCFEAATQLQRGDLTDAVKLGTLVDVLGTQNNLSKKIVGSLTAGTTRDLTLVLKMQETAGNEYQSMDLGCSFSVELTATQMAYEKDSFGNNYDENALSAKVPAARVMGVDADETVSFEREGGEIVTIVRPDLEISATAGIGGAATAINLNTVYKFEPTQTFDDMMASEYKYYIADFIISADRDVPANSMALAGYYDAWCEFNNDNWVALASDAAISAGTEIRLVKSMGASVHYKDICQYGNDGLGFMCGAVDLTGENIGTTLTVKLCLFETTADPNGSSANTEETGSAPIVIGEFKYTFTTKNVATADELATAIANGVENITLTKDIAVTGANMFTVPTGADVTVNLNGHNISADFAAKTDGHSAVFTINKDASLTINGEGNVHVVAAPTLSYVSSVFTNLGSLEINGGNYSMTYGSYADGYLLPTIVDTNSNVGKATTVINGGTFTHTRNMFRNFAQPQRGANNATLIINGGTFKGQADDYASIWNQKTSNSGVEGDGVVTINGGDFQYMDICNDFAGYVTIAEGLNIAVQP